MEKVAKKVHKCIHKYMSANNKERQISNEMLLSQDLGLGSMDQVNLFTNIADEFRVDIMQFEDEELVNIRSVADIIRLFEKKSA